MDYAEVRAAFLQPPDPDAPQAGTSGWLSPGRRLRDAIEPIAMISVWSEPSYDAYAALGLDFLQGYAWSRACVLGEPDASVVAAVFGVFEPGLAGLPWPDDDLAQLWHVATMLRELRGDSHLAAYVAAGLTGLEANLLTELQVGWAPWSYTATRGWSQEAMYEAAADLRERGLVAGGALTAAGMRLRHQLEEITDRQMAPVLEAVGPALDAIVPQLEQWSADIIDAGWFPPDPYKRASG